MSIHKNSKSKKEISPVIASIILIAVTITIAIAISGWIFSLFGTYTSSAAFKVVANSLDHTSNILSLTFSNMGGAADCVIQVTV